MECDTGDVVLGGLEVEATTEFELEVLQPVELAVREEECVLAPGLFRDVEAGHGFCSWFGQGTFCTGGVEGDVENAAFLRLLHRGRPFYLDCFG